MDNIELAKFIHKFEVDLDYRRYMTESFPNEKTRKLAHNIACDSIDWVYFPKSEANNYPALIGKAYKETQDNYLCVEMVEIKNNAIDNKYANLIIKSALDVNLLEKYKDLLNLTVL